MTDKEILVKWQQGLSKDKLSKIYKKEYNMQVKIIRSSIRHKGGVLWIETNMMK